ncbi:hypothetical protein [Polaromonas sp.]|uniref:hypothetical protein n=1 Tax=Polaromonas sp. TaxID=1869339 RepID=UPI003BB7879E
MNPTGSSICDRRQFAQKLASAAAASMALALLSGCASRPLAPDSMAEGILWQIDDKTLDLHGNWDKMGVHTLLIQWSALNGVSFIEGGPWPLAERLPDWQAIARQPWAKEVILGLAGHSDENAARADFPGLVEVSERLARLPTPLNVVGWYFPVEIDSSWQDARRLGPLLSRLPRPLWLSLYDSANVGPETLARWLDEWLPPDVGIFFQDGVGVHARNAAVARQHADVLIRCLGQHRVRMIAEAFRPRPGGGFRPATAAELREQLQMYAGLRVYLFDGPHYLSEQLVNELTLAL